MRRKECPRFFSPFLLLREKKRSLFRTSLSPPPILTVSRGEHERRVTAVIRLVDRGSLLSSSSFFSREREKKQERFERAFFFFFAAPPLQTEKNKKLSLSLSFSLSLFLSLTSAMCSFTQS